MRGEAPRESEVMGMCTDSKLTIPLQASEAPDLAREHDHSDELFHWVFDCIMACYEN
jgi:hypothetical protein